MRITLDIDPDVLEAAQERARLEGRTTGQVVSELLRRVLNASAVAGAMREPAAVSGFRPFLAVDRVVTNAAIDALRADDAY